MKKVAVLVSGGVDSSVALALLKEQGYDLTAFYLKIWLEDELSFLGSCPWEEDLSFVRQVCADLNVPLQIVNLQKEYFSRVVNLAVAQIKRGLTPNPDIFCNSLIKFGVFFEHLSDKFDYVATGHYAQVEHGEVVSTLKLSNDRIKDQTYFLSRLTQTQLRKALFPVGALNKVEVRSLAVKLDLPSKNRKDSQGLCFLGKIKFEDFIREAVGVCEGDIVELETGKVLGKHKGFWFFTIGQRKGLGLSGGPFYVSKKDAVQNIIFVSNRYFEVDKKRDLLLVTDLHWLAELSEEDGPNMRGVSMLVKLRHGPVFYSCLFERQGDDARVQLINVRDQGISPGQFVVFYKDDVCVGSGMIVADLDTPTRLMPG